MQRHQASESDSASHPTRFFTPKTRGFLRAGNAALADFLTCATLDPLVDWLATADAVPVRHDGTTALHRPDVLVGHRTGDYVVDIRPLAEARRPFYAAAENAFAARGLRYEVRPAPNMKLVTRARRIWACRDTEVSAGQQFRVLQYLNEVGGVAALRDLEDVLKDVYDPRAAILGLIAWDILEADILLALTGDTPVRRAPERVRGARAVIDNLASA